MIQGQREPATDTSGSSSSKAALSTRIISGSVGSIITSLIVTPLEVAKVRTQAGGVSNSAAVRRSKSATPVPPLRAVPCPRGCGTFVLYNGHMDCVVARSAVPYFNKTTGKLLAATASEVPEHRLGTFAMIRRIFAREGLAGVYAGLRPTLVMAAPNTVLYYTAYEEIVWRMRHNLYIEQQQHPFLSHNGVWLFPLLAGGSARLLSSTLTAPLEYIRTLQAAAMGQNSRGAGNATGLWHDFRTIVKDEGFGSLYRGLRPTLWRDVPFSAIYWLLLEQFRLAWQSVRAGPLSPLEQTGEAFVNGAAAGTIAAACTTPFDLAKTRQQTFIAETVSEINVSLCKHDCAVVYEASSNVKPTGTFHQLRMIAQTEGVAGLWRGNQARMLKVAPSCAIMLSSYEFGKRLLE